MRGSRLSLLLFCAAGLASCVLLIPDAEKAVRIGSLERIPFQDVPLERGSPIDLFANRVALVSRLDDVTHRDEIVLAPPYTVGDSIFWMGDDLILEPWPRVEAVNAPFSCRITPIAASSGQRQWRMFPCDRGVSLFMVAGAGDSTVPNFFLVSAFAAEALMPSDADGLPAVHVLEMLSGEIAVQLERVVRSARFLWDFTDVLLVLLIQFLGVTILLTVLIRGSESRRGTICAQAC